MGTRLVWSNDGSDVPDLSGGPRPPDAADTSDLARRAIRAGTKAPDFRLHDQRGNRVALRALLQQGAVVLRFCRNRNTAVRIREFASLSALHNDMKALGATLVIIAVEPFDPPLGKDAASFPFPILPDVDGDVAESYGLTFLGRPQDGRETSDGIDEDKGARELMSAPATYVIDRTGVVALAFIDLECRSLMDHGQILMALECLGRRS
jgi:peroxiredoxin